MIMCCMETDEKGGAGLGPNHGIDAHFLSDLEQTAFTSLGLSFLRIKMSELDSGMTNPGF